MRGGRRRRVAAIVQRGLPIASMGRVAYGLMVRRRSRRVHRRDRESRRGESQSQHDQETEETVRDAHRGTMRHRKSLFKNAIRRSIHRLGPSNAAPHKVHIKTA